MGDRDLIFYILAELHPIVVFQLEREDRVMVLRQQHASLQAWQVDYLLFLPSEVFSVLMLVAFRFPAAPRAPASRMAS